MIGKKYKDHFINDKITHKNKNPEQLLRLWYFIYLTGARIMEPFANGLEKPIISFSMQINPKSGKPDRFVTITKVNAKHRNADGNRQMMQQILPILNVWEQEMWHEITSGGLETNVDNIFKFKEWKSIKQPNINCLFKTNFKTDLKDPLGKLHTNCGISPHIIRHMRATYLSVTLNVPENQLLKLFGWKDKRMLYHYVDIMEAMDQAAQLEIWRRGGFFTQLSIDMGKEIPAY